MSELRWHPFLREWVGVAANRQDRPQMPKDWCPFDPGSGRVPDQYDVYLYPNDFAAFSRDNPPFIDEPGLYRATGAYGVCDVVIYHPDHNMPPSQLTAEHWRKVVDLWTVRWKELAADSKLVYIYIFENTGEAIGVTMPHPHGQIYSFPFIPPYIQRELTSARESYDTSGKCLYCTVLEHERNENIRVIYENDGFTAFVPFWAKWPAEVHLYGRRHTSSLIELDDDEKTQLAVAIKTVRVKYDRLYGKPMPLMMILRQRPTSGDHPYMHFHIQFYPIQRSATKIKYLAGVESGAGTFLNDTVAEQRAAELRAIDPGF